MSTQAENAELRRQLALAAEDQHADRAEAASLRERLEAAERERVEAVSRAQARSFQQESMDKLWQIRAAGWSVAVHNDYRLKGCKFTFWLFTHPDGQWIKGEGATDAEAIAVAWASFYETARSSDAREDSADNHRGEEGYER